MRLAQTIRPIAPSEPPGRISELITALIARLGDSEGLQQVILAVSDVNNGLMSGRLELPRQELAETDAALATLGQQIAQMNRLVRGRLAELGWGEDSCRLI